MRRFSAARGAPHDDGQKFVGVRLLPALVTRLDCTREGVNCKIKCDTPEGASTEKARRENGKASTLQIVQQGASISHTANTNLSAILPEAGTINAYSLLLVFPSERHAPPRLLTLPPFPDSLG